MIAAANIVTDLYLSLAALLGLFVLHRSLQANDPFNPLTRRFLFGIRVTMMLFAGRALVVLTGGEGFRFLVLLAAALLPLAVLLLTEGLLRRHAPLWIKVGVAIGTVIFTLWAFIDISAVAGLRLWSLMGFQVAGFSAVGLLVLTRDRAGLSAAENQTVGRLGISLILIIPTLAADFLMVYLRLPIQISALAVLVLCWLAIGLGRMHDGHRGPTVALLVLLVAAFVSGALLGMLAQMGRGGSVIAIAVNMATMLVVAILYDARQQRIAVQSQSLLQHLALGGQGDAVAFLRDLHAHPMVEGAAIVEDQQLADLDSAVLDKIFVAAPVLRKSAPPALGPSATEHIGHLFDRFAATHILQITAAPRLLVALAMPALNTSPLAELELQAVQRMAALIAKSEGRV